MVPVFKSRVVAATLTAPSAPFHIDEICRRVVLDSGLSLPEFLVEISWPIVFP